MSTKTGQLGVTFPDNTLQTTAAIAGAPGFGGAPYFQIFTSSYTWTCPAGVTRVRATVVAGGGGGYDASDSDYTGGTGGCSIGVYTVTPGTTYTIVVGGGGTGFAPSYDQPNPSPPGGYSAFDAFCSASGGAGPQFNPSTGGIDPGVNGYGVNGNIRNVASCVGVCSLSGTGLRVANPYSNNPVVWSTSASFAAGAAGEGSSASGGSGGAVMLEWWGG